MKSTFSEKDKQRLHNTRSYMRYRAYLNRMKPKSRKHAKLLLEEAYRLVEDWSGHKHWHTAAAASSAVALLIEEYPHCIDKPCDECGQLHTDCGGRP